jgi:orotidine-5'-phosphate decarboxylase
MQTVKYAKSKGLIVIEDAKRNDISKTAEQYADGHLGEVELLDGRKIKVFDMDGITVTPYLGSDGINPFINYCKAGKGIFVLDRTSNKSAAELQDRLVLLEPEEIELINSRLEGSGLTLFDLPVMKQHKGKVIVVLNFVADKELIDSFELKYDYLPIAPNYAVMALLIDKWGSAQEAMGQKGYSSVGAVVGATYPTEARILRKLMPRTPFLGPGYGGQGATGEDAQNLFNEDGFGAGINNSSGLDYAYKKKPWSEEYGPNRYAEATRAAAIAMRDDIVGALRKHGKWHLD